MAALLDQRAELEVGLIGPKKGKNTHGQLTFFLRSFIHSFFLSFFFFFCAQGSVAMLERALGLFGRAK